MRHNARIAWALFLLFGCAAAFLRYGSQFWPGQYQQASEAAPWLFNGFQDLRALAPWIILICHVVIVLGALREAIFQGILCVLVPAYSFYFLFVIWDHFLLRAVVGALLVGLGQDAAVTYQGVITRIIDSVTRWIASGG